MSRARRIASAVACAVVILVGVIVYALFHGSFDHGQFEIKQAQWSSSKEVAVVAERSDQEALSSYMYFVLIADHLPSTAELRRAYHSDAVVFAAASSCVALHWENRQSLIVACNGHPAEPSHIAVQKRQSMGVAISYENIPVKQSGAR